MEGLSLAVCAVYYKFSAPRSGETMFRMRTCFVGASLLRTSAITMPSLVGLRHRTPLGSEKRSTFVCLSVTLLNDKVCERHFAIKALEYGNDLGILGKFVVIIRVQLCLYNAGRSHRKTTKLKIP